MNNVVLSKWRGSLPILETSNMGANGDCCVVDGHNASSTQSTTKHVYVVTYPPHIWAMCSPKMQPVINS